MTYEAGIEAAAKGLADMGWSWETQKRYTEAIVEAFLGEVGEPLIAHATLDRTKWLLPHRVVDEPGDYVLVPLRPKEGT